MPKEIVRLIVKTCVKNFQFLPSCWNCFYDLFVFTLKLTQNYIHVIVLNNRFKGFGDSICIVLCPQELEQQSVQGYMYMHAHFLKVSGIRFKDLCCPA